VIVKRSLFGKIDPYVESPEAIIVTGMRRTGKTTLLSYFFDRVAPGNKLFLDLENPINRKLFDEPDYEAVKRSLELRGLDLSKKAHVFLDEIQFARSSPSVVKYLLDHYAVKFFLSGSASFYLKNMFAETLAGRKFIFELFPLNFREFMGFKDPAIRVPERGEPLAENDITMLAPYYDEFLRYGGFPGVVLKMRAEEKERALDDIFTSFFQQEVLQLGDFRKNDLLRDLILVLAERTGAKVEVQRLSRELGLARPTLAGYLAFLEGTYLIKLVRPFSRGMDAEIRKLPKVYFCDSGLAGRLARLDAGSVFENSVFQSLRGAGELNYYQRKNGAEIDFIIDKKRAYEVKTTASAADVRALNKISAELQLETNAVISRNYSPVPGVEYGFTLP
jgi:predicted AAA+ superfamily ATPase